MPYINPSSLTHPFAFPPLLAAFRPVVTPTTILSLYGVTFTYMGGVIAAAAKAAAAGGFASLMRGTLLEVIFQVRRGAVGSLDAANSAVVADVRRRLLSFAAGGREPHHTDRARAPARALLPRGPREAGR